MYPQEPAWLPWPAPKRGPRVQPRQMGRAPQRQALHPEAVVWVGFYPPAGRSGNGTRGNAATGMPVGEGNKKPGDLAAHPGSDGLPAILGSLEGLLRSVRARIRLAWRDGLSLLLESQRVHRNSIHIRSPNAVLAAALTPPKQKARSARAVRASDGRKALTRSSSPDRRLYKVVSVVARACTSGRALES